MNFSPIEAKGNFIGGDFVKPVSHTNKFESLSPANHNDLVGVFSFSLESVNEAVDAAKVAFLNWSNTPEGLRLEKIKALGTILADQKEKFVRILAREVGKPVWECRLELQAAILRCQTEPETMGWLWRRANWNQDGRELKVDHRPRGVVAVLAPFNLPIDTTLSYMLPALFLGNTVVLKPSKQTPATAQMLCEAIMQAGFPAGVVNMIQGDKETARRLAQNSAVNVVLFTGPYELGNQIKRDTVDPVDKTLVMETGGKNVSIVWDGADLVLAQRMILEGAYITGGQRSTATSRLIIQRKLAPEFLEKFHLLAKQLVIGNPFNEEPTPFMGALIHPISVERYLKFQGIAIREGCECLMRGKAFENAGTTGHYVTPSIYIVKDHSPEKIYKSIFQQTELFGPCLSVYLVDTLDEAVAVANTVDYGLTASVFADQQTAKYFWQKLNFGNLHWNLPTTHQDVALPFGGVRKSGNGTFTGYQLAASLVRPIGGIWNQGGAVDPLPGLSD